MARGAGAGRALACASSFVAVRDRRARLSEAIRRAASRALTLSASSPTQVLSTEIGTFVGDGAKTVVKGDCESVSIASASIVAKYFGFFDVDLAPALSGYRFELNKGYPSPSTSGCLRALAPHASPQNCSLRFSGSSTKELRPPSKSMRSHLVKASTRLSCNAPR